MAGIDHWAPVTRALLFAGEHIDYCGYAVLPMAIEQDIVFAVSPNAERNIVLANANPEFG